MLMTQNPGYTENSENTKAAQDPVDAQEGVDNVIPVPDDPESDDDIPWNPEIDMAGIQDKTRRSDSNDLRWKYGILDDPKHKMSFV